MSLVLTMGWLLAVDFSLGLNALLGWVMFRFGLCFILVMLEWSLVWVWVTIGVTIGLGFSLGMG